MSNDKILRTILSDKVSMTPDGRVADDLSPDQFAVCHELFFDKIFEIHASDISDVEGYGWFQDNRKPAYGTCKELLMDTFAEDKEGYWYNWRELFETSLLERSFFGTYFEEMESRIPYCEGRRYLVNNNTFFENMITDEKTMVGFSDWSRSGICDALLDFAIMDLNKPYLLIPELLVAYCKEREILIPDFHERYLCMAYYKGIDVLRWHASIDDEESCISIMKSIRELKDRIYAL